MCLNEGWTIRPPSPVLPDDDNDVFTPEPLDPAMIADGKVSILSLCSIQHLVVKYFSRTVAYFLIVMTRSQNGYFLWYSHSPKTRS